jgi:hypothetical protein
MKKILMVAMLLFTGGVAVAEPEWDDNDYPIYERYATLYYDCVVENAHRLERTSADLRTKFFGSKEACHDTLISIRILWGEDVAMTTSRVANRLLESIIN